MESRVKPRVELNNISMLELLYVVSFQEKVKSLPVEL